MGKKDTNDEEERKAIVSLYINSDKRLKRNFNEMSFKKMVKYYMVAELSVNELSYAERITLELRIDEEAVKIRKTIENLKQYQKDMIGYFNKLKKSKKELSDKVEGRIKPLPFKFAKK